jgi:hypothetical protein
LPIADCRLPIADFQLPIGKMRRRRSNRQSAIGNSSTP